MTNQIIVADIFIYSERLDADVGAQLFSRHLLGVLQRPVRDGPEFLGGSPQADRKNRQSRAEYRDYQRGPIVGPRSHSRSEVGTLRHPGADLVIAQTMICNAAILAYRNLKAGYRPPRKPNGDASNPNGNREEKKPPVFPHSLCP